jgi:hypothetical protein
MFNDFNHNKFKLTLGTVIFIDGTRYSLEELIESDTVYLFTNFTLKNNEIELKIIDIPGQLIVQNKKLFIKPQVGLTMEAHHPVEERVPHPAPKSYPMRESISGQITSKSNEPPRGKPRVSEEAPLLRFMRLHLQSKHNIHQTKTHRPTILSLTMETS